MTKVYLLTGLFIAIFLLTCKKPTINEVVNMPIPAKSKYGPLSLNLGAEVYYDKILGALVGSAIGDAMGASTEMWHRSDIQKKYGYIVDLTPATRDKSPEGTWGHNMPAGATTDDTRWKYLVGQYISRHRDNLSAEGFASFIEEYYQSQIENLAQEDIMGSTDALDQKIEKINWIKEWARVAMAYRQGGKDFYDALSRFYGGEMACAGILYTPMFGLIAQDVESAYITAFDHAIFDIGYARDISGIVAALTRMALQTSTMDSILNVAIFVDPYDYKDSRLVGRLSNTIAEESRKMVQDSRDLTLEDTLNVAVPGGYPGTKQDWMQQGYVYSQLERKRKAIAFHAGEIWQISYAGLVFGKGDFQKTIEFIVNYGRDNDTVAAAVGMILGAKVGYSNLPKGLRDEVVKVSQEIMGIDLELLASEMVGEE